MEVKGECCMRLENIWKWMYRTLMALTISLSFTALFLMGVILVYTMK